MKTFKDTEGREWKIAINVEVIKRVRDLLQINLLDILQGELVERLIKDPILLCDVVYVVCKPEAESRSVSDADFGGAMCGDPIEHATKALLEEIADFSPSPRDRANINLVIQRTWDVMDRGRDAIEERIKGGMLDQVIEATLAGEMRNADESTRQLLESVKNSSGNAPASSE